MRSPETEEESSFWDAAFFAAVGAVASTSDAARARRAIAVTSWARSADMAG